MLEGSIFVTGGAGFLARALYARAQREGWYAKFTCFSRDDAKHVKVMDRWPEVRCIRGDVAGAGETYLAAAMRGHDLVLHLAAVKYVDLAEANVWDTVRVNVDGSRDVYRAAIAARVPRVVSISSDKACEPVNVYGMTKAVMERLSIEAGRLGTGTVFTQVRYGNVVASTGSLIPKMKAQLAATGVVEATDPVMTRFWMSWDEAIDAVNIAARAGNTLTVIPSCRAMRLGEVINAAIGNAPRRLIGLRPGEKRDEQLIGFSESVRCAFQPGDGIAAPYGVNHWLLHPPGVHIEGQTEFVESSSKPLSGWMGADEMRRLSEEAEHV